MTKMRKDLLKASFIGTMAATMLVPFWSRLAERVGGTLIDAGLGFCLWSIVSGVAVVLIGRTSWFHDNAKNVVFWGFVLAGIGDVLYVFVANVWELLLTQSIIGVSVGLLNPAWDSLYEDDQSNKAAKWSFWSGGVTFFAGLAALLGGYVISAFGFTALFVTMGILDCFAVYFAWQIKTSPETAVKSSPTP